MTSSTSATLTGVVTDSAGVVVPNAKVWIRFPYATSQEEVILVSTTTGLDGAYTFADVAPTEYQIYVDGPARFMRTYYPRTTEEDFAETVTVEADETTTVDMQLISGASVAGRVTAATGQGVAGAVVDFRVIPIDCAPRWQTGCNWHSQSVGTVTTDADGFYRSELLEPGRSHAIGYSAPTYQTEYSGDTLIDTHAASLVLDEGEERTGVDAVLSPGATLAGYVRDIDGAALSDPWLSAKNTDLGLVYTATGNPDGSYEFDGLPSGTYSVDAFRSGYGESSRTVAIEAPDEVSADFALLPDLIEIVKPPSIRGPSAVGRQLTSQAGSWTPAGLKFTIQWFRDDVAIPGATTATYLVTPRDAGSTLTVRYTATKPKVAPKSAEAEVVAYKGVLGLTGRFSLRGKAKVGGKLAVVIPTSRPRASATYRWFRSGKPIPGIRATKAIYRPSKADRGKRLSVRVTLTRFGYNTAARTLRTSKVR